MSCSLRGNKPPLRVDALVVPLRSSGVGVRGDPDYPEKGSFLFERPVSFYLFASHCRQYNILLGWG
jgi:hypothetical protein